MQLLLRLLARLQKPIRILKEFCLSFCAETLLKKHGSDFDMIMGCGRNGGLDLMQKAYRQYKYAIVALVCWCLSGAW